MEKRLSMRSAPGRKRLEEKSEFLLYLCRRIYRGGENLPREEALQSYIVHKH